MSPTNIEGVEHYLLTAMPARLLKLAFFLFLKNKTRDVFHLNLGIENPIIRPTLEVVTIHMNIMWTD